MIADQVLVGPLRITDEAHRSQYDTLALNMRTALPNASFLAFTGTPLIAGEEKTREVFGDYVSVYDFRQSAVDGATVRLYYENRIPELQLTNKDLNEDMERLLEEAELDEEQEMKMEREFAREYHLITRDDRLEAVAKDIVEHFTGRGFQGKAMVISIDKAAAVRTYNKVQKYWERKLGKLKVELENASEVERNAIEDQIREMQETDMAVVVSQAQNEIQYMQKKGLDIRPHHKRIVEEDLDTKFKDPDDAVDALVASDDVKRRFLDLANTVHHLYKAILPDPAAHSVRSDCVLIHVIAEKIRALTPPADISEVMDQVEDLLDRSIAAEGYVISKEPDDPFGPDHLVDLSVIDFEALRKRFEHSRKRTLTERLKNTVARKLQQMVRLNRTRMDYLERFQQMIDEYNSGSVNVEEFFRRLMEFADSLNEEEQRTVGEQLSEEELAVFDLLIKPEMDLTAKERAEVKKTARDLLGTLKHEKLVLDWRKRQQARAEVRVTIETLLDQRLPPAFRPEIYQRKADAVYQHVYDCYYGSGKSVYSAVA